jgi:hypothetical protein
VTASAGIPTGPGVENWDPPPAFSAAIPIAANVTPDSLAASATNVAGLQAQINDLPSPVVLQLPTGRVWWNGLLSIPVNKHVELRGFGPSHTGGTLWGTVLYRDPSYTGEMVNAVGTGTTTETRVFVSLRDLGINGGNYANVPVRIARASELHINNVRLSNSGREALVLTQVWNGYIDRLYVHTSGNLATDTPAVRMDSATGEEGSNGLFWSNFQFEGNNGVNLRVTAASGQYTIAGHFVNGKFEDAAAVTWPAVELLRCNAQTFDDIWFMRGRKLTDLRATGPTFRMVGPVNTADEEKRANRLINSNLSVWGDPTCIVEHEDGPLIIDGCSFTGEPDNAYIDVESTVGQDDSIIGTNHYERPDKAVRDQRTTRRTNTNNGRLGAFAPSAPGWTGAVGAVSANNGRISRFVPTRNMRVKGIGFHVSTAAGANDNFDVGIYDSALAKIVSSGATAGKLNSTGKKRIDITETTLIAGQAYYIAGSVGTLGGTAAQIAQANFTQAFVAAFFGATAGLVEADAAATIHPLGATITPAGGSTAGFLFFLHED